MLMPRQPVSALAVPTLAQGPFACTLYHGAVRTMAFARPHFDERPIAIDFAVAQYYPARGEYAGTV